MADASARYVLSVLRPTNPLAVASANSRAQSLDPKACLHPSPFERYGFGSIILRPPSYFTSAGNIGELRAPESDKIAARAEPIDHGAWLRGHASPALRVRKSLALYLWDVGSERILSRSGFVLALSGADPSAGMEQSDHAE